MPLPKHRLRRRGAGRSWLAVPLALLIGGCAPAGATRAGGAEPAVARASEEATAAGLARAPGGAGVDVPDAAALRAMPLRAHPRLFLTDERLAELRGQIASDSTAARWYRQLKARADAFVADPEVARHVIPDGLRLLATSRRTLEKVATLGLVGRVEGDARYRERAWREIEAVAAFPDWNPKHFLDVGEMTTAVAVGYDWFHDEWTPEQRRVAEEAIVRHGLRPALDAYGGRWVRNDWPAAEHNWNQVTNGGVAIGALAVMESAPDTASLALHEALTRLPRAMRHYAPDGAWNEGPGYWHYASLYNTLLLSALETAAGRDFGLSEVPGYSEAGWFAIYMTGPAGPSFNFADVDPELGPTKGAELLWMARRYGEPSYAAHEMRYARELNENRANPFALVWYDPSLRGASMAAAPLDRWFRGVEVVSMRSAWDDPDAVFVGFKAGDNKANHSDLDLGTFVLDALGVRWARELGSDDYNLPGYFSRGDGARWRFYRMRAEGQNTLVLGPDAEPDQDPEAAAPVVAFESSPERVHAVADLSAAYARHARSVRRGVALLDGRRRVLVQDEIRAERPTDAWWFMHTSATVRVQPDGSALLERDGRRLWARVLAPAGAGFTVMDATPLPGSPVVPGQDANRGIRKLTVRLPAVTDARLAVLLVPLREGEAPPADVPAVRPLEAW